MIGVFTRTFCALLSVVFTANAWAEGAKVFLHNAGVDPDARARVRFAEGEKGEAFSVKVEALEVGKYAVLVGGEQVGELVTGKGGEGQLILGGTLTFDPWGSLVEIAGVGTGEIYFYGALPPAGEAPPFKIELLERFSNTGEVAKAAGEASLRSFRGKVRFRVKVRGLPPGIYNLVIAGEDVGEIHLRGEKKKGKGRVKFDSRFARGSVELLDFDPLCARIEVAQTIDASTRVFLLLEEFGSSAGLCPSGTTTTTSTSSTTTSTDTSTTTTTTIGGRGLM